MARSAREVIITGNMASWGQTLVPGKQTVCHGPCGPMYRSGLKAQGVITEQGNGLCLKGIKDDRMGIGELEREMENPGKGGGLLPPYFYVLVYPISLLLAPDI